MRQFVARQVGTEIVLAGHNDDGNALRRVFSEITPKSFRWRNQVGGPPGWRVVQTFQAQRRLPPRAPWHLRPVALQRPGGPLAARRHGPSGRGGRQPRRASAAVTCRAQLHGPDPYGAAPDVRASHFARAFHEEDHKSAWPLHRAHLRRHARLPQPRERGLPRIGRAIVVALTTAMSVTDARIAAARD